MLLSLPLTGQAANWCPRWAHGWEKALRLLLRAWPLPLLLDCWLMRIHVHDSFHLDTYSEECTLADHKPDVLQVAWDQKHATNISPEGIIDKGQHR